MVVVVRSYRRDGKIIELEVEDYIPYLDPSMEAETRPGLPSPGSVHLLGASVAPATPADGEEKRWWFVTENATNFATNFSENGGPSEELVRRRVTFDLHSREVIRGFG